MFIVKKYSSSGLWSGEPVKSFDTAQEASWYLENKANKLEAQGYEISDELNNGYIVWLEVTHDNIADAYQYRVVSED